eukprot:CAMPEP_0167760680 /NCGR_PEP_ID=MMETSP0110_2-20121227/11720_1 /TAXON_ID=629695 /ORGANISM="Gymnochlora sp., Strain CCMP2014" /LENGTH=113 /DNA_ID=CAMNT_0007647217 /DNA_START=17 /DNA_END=358 /DNA_ORIENTATION=-
MTSVRTGTAITSETKDTKFLIMRLGKDTQKEEKGKELVKPIYKEPGSFEKTLGTKKDKEILWTNETIDNEFLNKKSSKICCIYHKPRAFDESDSDESDYEKPESYNPNVKTEK